MLSMTKFITFRPEWEYDDRRQINISRSATILLNEWLEANPQVVIQSWQACPVGDHNELSITIQYTED